MTDSLREKVARALCPYLCPPGDDKWKQWLPEADAAILVCREHFAGVAEKSETWVGGSGEDDDICVGGEFVADAIRSEGDK